MILFHNPIVKGEDVPYSYRARAIIPAKNIGSEAKIIKKVQEAQENDIVVLSKKHTIEDRKWLKSMNIDFIMDVSDDKFNTHSSIWNATIGDAVAVTTTCQHLKQVVIDKTKKSEHLIHVIEDPTEREQEPPKFSPGKRTKVVWYGSYKNYRELYFPWIRKALNTIYPTDVRVITNYKNQKKKYSKDYRLNNIYLLTAELKQMIHDELDKQFDLMEQWTYRLQGEAVRESDLVFLPTPVNKPWQVAKGNNRPVDAIRQGRLVIMNPGTPSWDSLREYCYNGNCIEGYQWAMNKNNREEIYKRITEGQKFIEENYSPKAIGRKWKNVYEKYSRN